MLHFVPDDGQARAIVATLTEPLASGSYLAISHWQYHAADEDLAQRYSGAVVAIARRTREQIGGLLPAGWEPVEPGLAPVTAWRPPVAGLEPGFGSGSSQTGQFVGAVVRKPLEAVFAEPAGQLARAADRAQAPFGRLAGGGRGDDEQPVPGAQRRGRAGDQALAVPDDEGQVRLGRKPQFEDLDAVQL